MIATFLPQAASLAWMLIFSLLSALLTAQETTIRTTVPLVVAPTTVTDAAGNHISGLTGDDFLLYDNKKRREIQADVSYLPISLVIIVLSFLPIIWNFLRGKKAI